MSAAPHQMTIRVYYEDTDAGGIVYHTSYLRFAERARTETMRAAGVDHETLRRDHGSLLVVRRCTIDFKAPARLDDLVEVTTSLAKMGGASFDLRQVVRSGEQVLVALEVTIAVVDATGRPKRMPPLLRTALA